MPNPVSGQYLNIFECQEKGEKKSGNVRKSQDLGFPNLRMNPVILLNKVIAVWKLLQFLHNSTK